MIGPNPDAWEALQENPDQGYAGEGAMSDAVETLKHLLVMFESGAAVQTFERDVAEEYARAIREVLDENERLREACEGVLAAPELQARIEAALAELEYPINFPSIAKLQTKIANTVKALRGGDE